MIDDIPIGRGKDYGTMLWYSFVKHPHWIGRHYFNLSGGLLLLKLESFEYIDFPMYQFIKRFVFKT